MDSIQALVVTDPSRPASGRLLFFLSTQELQRERKDSRRKAASDKFWFLLPNVAVPFFLSLFRQNLKAVWIVLALPFPSFAVAAKKRGGEVRKDSVVVLEDD